MVHVDQLGRPIRMTDSLKASVWDVQYTPWGAPHAITGAQTLNARFPGQWFQLESSLAYNWHRHYDQSLGRYTQPDPLGFVDGPSVYAYGIGSPLVRVDKDGRFVQGELARRVLVQCVRLAFRWFTTPPPQSFRDQCTLHGDPVYTPDAKVCNYKCKFNPGGDVRYVAHDQPCPEFTFGPGL